MASPSWAAVAVKVLPDLSGKKNLRHKKLRLPPFPSQLQEQTYFITINFTAGTKQTVSFSINLFQRGGVVQDSLKRI